MMFGEVIGEITFTFSPIYMIMSLADAVPNPIKVHIHGFGLALFDCVVGDAGGSAVVGDQWGGWLWMAKFFQGDSFGGGFLTVVEESGANSASDALERTSRMIVHGMLMGPLRAGAGAGVLGAGGLSRLVGWLNMEYTSKEYWYQSDDFQTKQRPPQEFPDEFNPETTLSGIFRPFLKTSSLAIMKQTVLCMSGTVPSLKR
jgi:hypothetical protein